MNNYKGFTLVELMIVVAIIGILAAIAIPTYQSFIARAQAAESIVLLDSARINSEDYISLSGSFPINKVALIHINTITLGSFGEITGTANTTANSAEGDIIYQFKAAGVNESLKGKSVWYNRTIDGKWECRTDLSQSLTPKMCFSGYSAPTGS